MECRKVDWVQMNRQVDIGASAAGLGLALGIIMIGMCGCQEQWKQPMHDGEELTKTQQLEDLYEIRCLKVKAPLQLQMWRCRDIQTATCYLIVKGHGWHSSPSVTEIKCVVHGDEYSYWMRQKIKEAVSADDDS